MPRNDGAMKNEDVGKLAKFLNYFQGESDRGSALIGAAMIESKLEKLLDSILIDNKSKEDAFDGQNAILGTFSSKIRMCHMLGIISDKECEEFQLVRKIRNKFAHHLDEISFDDSPIREYCLALKASTPGDLKAEKRYRQLYINSIVLSSLALWYRPEFAKNEIKLKQHSWSYQL